MENRADGDSIMDKSSNISRNINIVQTVDSKETIGLNQAMDSA